MEGLSLCFLIIHTPDFLPRLYSCSHLQVLEITT